jgi:hypothetical protein
MSENEFIMAIQAVMTAALEKGHPATMIFEWTLSAAEDWLEETNENEEEE